MCSEIYARAFFEDALPLIYRAQLDGKIVFLEGGFHRLLNLLKTTAASFQTIQELLSFLCVEKTTIDKIFDELAKGRSKNVDTKVTIDINGNRRRHLWIGTISKDNKHIQGQLIDVEDFEQIQDNFDRLRELTYGTKFLGERVATGQESARIRSLSIMFVDAVDSTSRIFSMEIEKAKQYVEDLAEIITSVAKEHNGYVDKFMGDGALIIWGYQILPVLSCANHAVDSLLAGKELLKRCKEYNYNRTGIEQIHIRIGIASGDVFSGVFKNNDRMIFTSIGRAVNVAARLEKAAENDSILIEHDHLIKCQENDPNIIGDSKCTFWDLKGIPHKIRACRIELS